MFSVMSVDHSVQEGVGSHVIISHDALHLTVQAPRKYQTWDPPNTSNLEPPPSDIWW